MLTIVESSSSRRARVGVEYDASTRAPRPKSLVVTLERKWSDDVVDATHANPFKGNIYPKIGRAMRSCLRMETVMVKSILLWTTSLNLMHLQALC